MPTPCAEHSDQCRRYISLNFGHPECDCGCHSPWVLAAEAEVERLEAEVTRLRGEVIAQARLGAEAVQYAVAEHRRAASKR